jgi:hypothetical protein
MEQIDFYCQELDEEDEEDEEEEEEEEEAEAEGAEEKNRLIAKAGKKILSSSSSFSVCARSEPRNAGSGIESARTTRSRT